MDIMIRSLDQSNPLYLHANDSNYASIVSLKLTGVDNYKIWASAMKLALQIKHKMGFVTGTCTRETYLASALLLEQWDRCYAVVLNSILSSLFRDVYLGHVFSDNAQTAWKELNETYDRIDREFNILTKLRNCTCVARNEVIDHDRMLKLMQFLMGLDYVYQPIRSSILTKEILLEVNDAFVIVSREESHRGIPSSSVKTDKPQAYAFVARQSDNNINRNNNWSNNGNNMNKGVYDSLQCKNCGLKGHTIDRCFEIIGYPPGFKRNPNLKPTTSFSNNKSNNVEFKKANLGNNDSKTAGNISFTSEQFFCANVTMNGINYHLGWIIDSWANKHMTNSTKDMVDLVDVFDLKLTVGYPNGTLAKITHVGNLKLNNDDMLFNVLVIPEYTVSLLSVHKLIKDSKFSVGFDETKCYIQDLKRGRVMETGSEFFGLC
ncbi:ribonuclease H-like domain-containing protein [Tanacetum coccineum]